MPALRSPPKERHRERSLLAAGFAGKSDHSLSTWLSPPARRLHQVTRGQTRAAPAVALDRLREAALSRTYVSLGARRTTSPHEFYRYPARFSPEFARAAIETFTEPGDIVLDPFVGGGTTLVEAMLSGRPSVGSDLNPLATFVTEVKTSPLRVVDLDDVRRWVDRIPKTVRIDRRAPALDDWEAGGYLKDLNDVATWHIRHLIAVALASLSVMTRPKAERFARCTILRTAQWALDMRSEVPSGGEFRATLIDSARAMIEVAVDFAAQANAAATVLTQAVPGLAMRSEVAGISPALVLTSPPYPGVYVLYHRWKLRGRREISAPYWISDTQDGHGISRYTMGAKSDPSLRRYFASVGDAFTDIAALVSPATTVVQIVGFNDVDTQLGRYLNAMERAGFEEFPLGDVDSGDGRLWRDVPNRRWWNEAAIRRGIERNTAREVVLAHRLAC